MNRISTGALLLVIFTAIGLIACGKDSEGVGAGWDEVGTVGASHDTYVVDESLLTPEADGTFSMANTPTPAPEDTPIPDPTATPAPTSTPEPTFEDIYRDDVTAALHAYYVAYHTRSQSAMNNVRTAATNTNELYSVEQMQANSLMVNAWLDYPDIDIVEVTHLKCDEVLCKIWYDAISNPPVENPVMGQDFPFDIEDYKYFRLVNGKWLEDHTHDTWTDECQSTHRE